MGTSGAHAIARAEHLRQAWGYGYFNGTDRFGNPISNGEATFELASAAPIGGLIKGAGKVANIGRKLEYIFGKATGSAHNVERSTEMLRQLQSIGIFDNNAGRSFVKNHLEDVYAGANGILQSNGRYLRESLLMGPNGGLKVESIWEGSKLITVKLFGKL